MTVPGGPSSRSGRWRDAEPVHAVLGLTCFGHDTAAALLIDGELAAFVEEERCNREAHTGQFPNQAIASVLRQGGIDIGDVERVALAHRPWDDLRRGAGDALRRRAPRRLATQVLTDARLAAAEQVLRRTWNYRGRVVGVGHHAAHAAGAFFASPFDDAAVLTLDRRGDNVSTTTGVGTGAALEALREIRSPDSLGEVYSAVGRFLGFRLHDEAKVTDLAARGGTGLVRDLRDLVALDDDGGFSVNLEWFGYPTDGPPVSAAFVDRFGPRRDPEAEVTERDADLAAAMQDLLEESVLHLARGLRRSSGRSQLCLSGGVAANGPAVARLVEEAGFDDVYRPPVVGDAGNALGAALWVWHEQLGRPRAWRMDHAFFGESWSEADCATALRRAGVACTRHPQPALAAAERVAGGRVVGWFQGRAEAGPQGLGARSILADPRDAAIGARVGRLQGREWFRPFAASVLDEHGPAFFDRWRPSPFTAPVLPVAAGRRLPAVTRADGSAVVHSVTRDANPLFHELIEQFSALTGVPVVLTTGLHLRDEPMVHRPGEAVADFLRSDIDSLVLGPFVADKPAKGPE